MLLPTVIDNGIVLGLVVFSALVATTSGGTSTSIVCYNTLWSQLQQFLESLSKKKQEKDFDNYPDSCFGSQEDNRRYYDEDRYPNSPISSSSSSQSYARSCGSSIKKPAMVRMSYVDQLSSSSCDSRPSPPESTSSGKRSVLFNLSPEIPISGVLDGTLRNSIINKAQQLGASFCQPTLAAQLRSGRKICLATQTAVAA